MDARVRQIDKNTYKASKIIRTRFGRDIEAYETGHNPIVALSRLKRLLTKRIKKK